MQNEPLAWYEDNYAESQWVKAVSGIILAVEWGFYYAIPLVSARHQNGEIQIYLNTGFVYRSGLL